jgi:hypothetical protein
MLIPIKTANRPSSAIIGSELVAMNQAVCFLIAGDAATFADVSASSCSAVDAGVETKRPSVSNRMMVRKMCFCPHYGKIVWTIIQSVFIEMVNDFTRKQRTIQALLDDVSVFVFPPFISLDFPIAKISRSVFCSRANRDCAWMPFFSKSCSKFFSLSFGISNLVFARLALVGVDKCFSVFSPARNNWFSTDTA